MSVLETERGGTMRSALRYRPVQTAPAIADVAVTHPRRAQAQKHSAPVPVRADVQEQEGGERSQARALRVPAGTARVPAVGVKRQRRQMHPLFYLGAGLVLVVLCWIGLTSLLAWGNNVYNTIVYGYPRTFQINAVVGHQDSVGAPSHFLALNLHGQVEVIELPGGDASHAHIFLGPQLLGNGSDLVPVTLRFLDVNGDGRVDMLIEVQGGQVVFLNTGQSFRSVTPAEQQQLHLPPAS